jgi:hypothetical protein
MVPVVTSELQGIESPALNILINAKVRHNPDRSSTTACCTTRKGTTGSGATRVRERIGSTVGCQSQD